MAEFDKILWSLDNSISAQDFERLCVDLLGREGYRSINPIGAQKDQGRDAELRAWRGKGRKSEVVVFQFSIQKRWQEKLAKDLEKMAIHCPEAVEFVFLSSQQISGETQARLRELCCKQYGCRLTFYCREWFRHRLSEFHPELARKYQLADALPMTLPACLSQIDLIQCEADYEKLDLGLHPPEFIRASTVDATRREPEEWEHWFRLAKIESWQGNSGAALRAIQECHSLMDEDDTFKSTNLRLMEAAIKADQAIETGSRPLLIEVLPDLEWAVARLNRGVDHYNLGNVLAELGRRQEAASSYETACALAPESPRYWVNYGSLCLKMGEIDRGIIYLDRALALHPKMAQALATRAGASLLFLNRPEEAVGYYRRALDASPDFEDFRHFHYWYAVALHRSGESKPALSQIERGLRLFPGDSVLLDAKAGVLADLWRGDRQFEDIALRFMLFRLEAFESDYASLAEVADIYLSKGNDGEAWRAMCMTLAPEEPRFRMIIEAAGFTICDLIVACRQASLFHRFRSDSSVNEFSGYMFAAGLRPEGALLPDVDHLIMVIFGKAAELAASDQDRLHGDGLSKAFKESVYHLAVVLPLLGGRWLAPERPADFSTCLDLISRGALALVDVVLSETARIFGFLIAQSDFAVEVDSLLRDIDLADITAGILVSLTKQTSLDWDIPSLRQGPGEA